MAAKETAGFRLGPLARKRLARMAADLDKSEPQVVELAITHMRGTMARDLPLYITVPDDDAEPPKTHKRPSRAA